MESEASDGLILFVFGAGLVAGFIVTTGMLVAGFAFKVLLRWNRKLGREQG